MLPVIEHLAITVSVSLMILAAIGSHLTVFLEPDELRDMGIHLHGAAGERSSEVRTG